MEDQIKQLVEEELARGNTKNGPFVDSHQAWAVIQEEIDEAETDMNSLKTRIQWLWGSVKADYPGGQSGHIVEIYKSAINLASEAIQVAAMARKFEQFLEGQGVK